MFFGGNGDRDAERRAHFRRRLAKCRAIVIAGHTHTLEFAEWRGEGGKITQFILNSVWKADELARPVVKQDSPASYADAAKAENRSLFWMYAPHAGKTADATWTLETRYPFRETAKLTVTSARPQTLRFRVPAWATFFEVGATRAEGGARFADVSVPAGRRESGGRRSGRSTPFSAMA